MDKTETLKLFESLIDTFQTEGWYHFIEDIQAKYTTSKEGAFSECDTGDKWHYRRGVVDMLGFIVSYQRQIEAAYEALENGEVTEESVSLED